MNEDDQWTLEELRSRYSLEPQLSDFFVEGCFDREVLSEVPLSKENDFTFYEIDTVNIPGDILYNYGLTTGNQQRVIALAYELNDLPAEANVRCLVDRDLEHWFEELTILTRLKWSTYCSMELHFLTKNCITDILIVAGNTRIQKIDDFIQSLHIILKQLYALRLADRELLLKLNWPPFRKHLTSKNDNIHFNIDAYMISLLTSNSQGKQRKAFEQCRNKWLSQLNCDTRLCTRGHDYTEILAWSMNNFNGKKELATRVAIERLFILLARTVDTLTYELK